MTEHKIIPRFSPSISQTDKKAVDKALQSTILVDGEETKKFEKEICSSVNCQFAVSFNSSYSAILATLAAIQVQPSDRIILSPNAPINILTAILQANLKPNFIDIDHATGNFNLEQLQEEMRPPLSRGRYIIMPYHFAGIAIDMYTLDHLIKIPDTIVVEMATDAFGSSYPTKEKVGSSTYSKLTIFSLNPSKTITAAVGGLVTTNDPKLYDALLVYRQNNNCSLTEMQAALGLSQLARLEEFIQKRQEIVNWYRKELSSIPHLSLFDAAFDPRTAYNLLTLQIDFEALGVNREKVQKKLLEHGITTEIHYTPLYSVPLYSKKFGDKADSFKEAEKFAAQTLTLPLYTDLTEKEVVTICHTIRGLLVR